jgi:very-short-patch-repair endonuclease
MSTNRPASETPRPPKHDIHAYLPKVVSSAAICRHKHAGEGREATISWIAAQQLGLVTTEQLRLAGIERGAVGHRVKIGRLHPLHRGVYLVGHPVPHPNVPLLAAVLACGEHVCISHGSAVALWDLVRTPGSDVDVTAIGWNCKSRSGIRVHRVAELHALDRRIRSGIQVTAPARSLLDFAGAASDEEARRAIAEARVRRLLRPGELEAAADRAPRRTGTARIRALLNHEGEPALTRSDAERRMLVLVREAQLPPPRTNARVLDLEVDFLWAEQRLVVEVDGYAFHSSARSFERDRKRDAILEAAGYRVMRVTWKQLIEEPIAVAVRIAQALHAAIPNPSIP